MTSTDRVLAVSPELALPIAVLTDSTAIVGRKRVGKSNTAVVIVEEALELGAQVIGFDPKGDWWGLRSSADGESEGYPIVVIGGSHAMLELNPLAGVAVADWVIDTGHSVVLDISELEPAECERFCSDFLKQLRKRKKAKPGAILLVIDEADELAPQDTRFGSAFLKTLGLVIWMVKRGGFLGIGTVVVTQRPASLNKNVLTQTELFIALQLMGEQDIDAADGWFKHHVGKEQRAEILANIGKLEKGEAYVLSGQVLKGVFRIRFRRRRTFDSGATPEMGEIVAEPKVVAQVDLQRLSEAMAAAVEEVKRTDPELLRKKIKELEGQLRDRPAAAPAEPERIEVPILTEEQVQRLETAVDKLDAAAVILGNSAGMASSVARDIASALSGAPSSLVVPQSTQGGQDGRRDDGDPVRAGTSGPQTASRGAKGQDRSNGPTQHLNASSSRDNDSSGRSALRDAERTPARTPERAEGITPTQQRILDAVALLEHRGAEISIAAIGAVAGVHPNGGRFRGDLKALQSAELLDATYRLTGGVRVEVDDKITDAQRRILEVIAEIQQSGIEPTTKTIASWLDLHENGGRFRGDLKHMHTTGLLEGNRLTRHARGLVQAAGAYSGLSAAFPRLDPSTSRLLELVRDAKKPLTVSEAAAKLNLHPNGGRFRSSIARLADMGLIRSKSELALIREGVTA